jgi:mycothiol synthase
VTAKKPWTIRSFTSADVAGVQKLWAGVASFDGSVPARGTAEMEALLAHSSHQGGKHWRVAVAGNGAIVGAAEVGFIGTVRTEVVLAVNPAWRQQGIGKGLLAAIPQDRRLLTTTRGSVQGAAELLTSAGFTERYREARMRRKAKGLEPMDIPDGASVVVDDKGDPDRCVAALAVVFGDDAENNRALVASWLARPGCKALYLMVAKRDYGICLVAGSPWAKKSERTAGGEPTVGVVEQVGLGKAMRGKGMSRPLVRAGLVQLAKSGFVDLEVLADRRRESAVELYEAEGFKVVDDDVHWIKREPWAQD